MTCTGARGASAKGETHGWFEGGQGTCPGKHPLLILPGLLLRRRGHISSGGGHGEPGSLPPARTLSLRGCSTLRADGTEEEVLNLWMNGNHKTDHSCPLKFKDW